MKPGDWELENNLQEIIDIAVKIATRAAMNGKPVASILWCPPTSATEESTGIFIVKYQGRISASESYEYEK